MAKTNNKALSILGESFGCWIVIGVTDDRFDYVDCECQCKDKTIKPVNVYSLTSGKSKSCGCMSHKLSKETVKARNPNG